MKTPQQMFGKVLRQIEADDRIAREAAADSERRAAEAEAHLDAPLSRRDVLEALETVLGRYGVHHHSSTRELLTRLMEALK